MSEENISERRRFERKEFTTEVKYTVLLPSANTGLTKNISEGGLCLLLNEQLDKGTILRVEFDLLGEESHEKTHIEAVVRIMWQEKQGDKFLTGVKFLT